ncbi:MAG: hypothetical protein IJD41_01870 [Alphaproteobacteria bacterium]|nr:hypothetical protein [Alphaproteobacteria bacterium]MBQ7127495.1 hypothetical protein [Alphaproteobacteria bacterium]
MGRPPKLLSTQKVGTISTDMEFIQQMVKTRNLTVNDLTVVLRHIDMVRDDLISAINARQKQK